MIAEDMLTQQEKQVPPFAENALWREGDERRG